MRAMSGLRLVCHMAVLSGDAPPNSLAAVRECCEAGAARLEIDIHSLAGPDYIVSHDRRLEDRTTGSGALGRATPDDVRTCRFRSRPGDRPPLLSEVIAIARDSRTELQLDLKDWRPMSDERLRVLDDLIAPIRERVIVSSGQDWNLLRLRAAAPHIAIGFDPGFYIAHPKEDGEAVLPRTCGAYGYLDDHPLAFGRTGEPADYLRERFELLLLQAPGCREYFLSYRLALIMLDDGFNAAEFLHARGVDANVWTPDYDGPDSVAALSRLLDAGYDRVTTNTPLVWQRALAGRT
jgi:glycerophosphoryl diester phosphodiesterase